MGQALYRKYRSKSLSEIVGQEHITETLDKALKSGRISHAYLFTGPRGVGKTSIARILAHEINQIPYTDDSLHMDIIEIDAASNRRIDEIRELRDKVAIAPTSAKYKVYIIDEVHMLTKEAFNALLKTLEEPPAHVVFILATTDAHKLPATIVSRTQRYSFKPVSTDKVISHLRSIATTENITVDDEALALLAAHGEGSFRDSISMLDQASSNGEALTAESVQLLLGIPPLTAIATLIQALQAHNAPLTAQYLNAIYDQGFQAAAIAKVLAQTLRSAIISGTSPLAGEQLIPLLTRLLDVAPAHDPDRYLEIVLLEAAGAGTILGVAPTVAEPVDPVPVATPALVATSKSAPQPKPIPAPKTVLAKPPVPPALEVSKESSVFDETVWPQVLTALKQKYNTLYGVVRMAKPTFEGKHLELAFNFAFHQKRLTDPKNKKILGDIIHELSGQAVHITCVVSKDKLAAPTTTVTTPVTSSAAPDMHAINDIFGGGEVIK